MMAIYLGILVALLASAYLASICVRGFTGGGFPPSGGRTTILRRTNPVKFWIAEVAAMLAIAALLTVGCFFLLAIMAAK